MIRHLALLGLLGLSCVVSTDDSSIRDDSAPDDDDSEESEEDSGESDDDDSSSPAPFYGPASYPPGQVHSPITPWVADRLWDVASSNSSLRDDVFMKVGASSTVSRSTLYCFAEDDWDLGAYTDLYEGLAFFQGGDAAGATPFARF